MCLSAFIRKYSIHVVHRRRRYTVFHITVDEWRFCGLSLSNAIFRFVEVVAEATLARKLCCKYPSCSHSPNHDFLVEQEGFQDKRYHSVIRSHLHHSYLGFVEMVLVERLSTSMLHAGSNIKRKCIRSPCVDPIATDQLTNTCVRVRIASVTIIITSYSDRFN